jgi:hypothetical protein
MITIDTTNPEVAKLFEDCEPGDSKTLTFTVKGKTPTSVQGEIETVEGYGDDSGGEGESAESEAPHRGLPNKIGDKMPPGVMVILHGRGK